MRISLGLGGGGGQPLPSAWVLPASSTSPCRHFMVTLSSCRTVSAGAVQEFNFCLFPVDLWFPKLRDVCVLVLERNREQVLSKTPLAHLFLSLRHLCCRNRSMTPFLCFVEQMFCCQLEELIRWLYNVADVTGSWVPPSPDAESVLASLHRYLVGCHPCSASFPLSCCCRQQAVGSQASLEWSRVHWVCKAKFGSTRNLLGGNCSLGNLPQVCLFQKPF